MKTPFLHPPTPSDLSRMYYELGRLGARCVGKKSPWRHRIDNPLSLLTLASEMSRYDPRLFGVLVEYLYHHWHKWNPFSLRKALLECETPQIWGVIGEFISGTHPDPEARNFFDYLLKGVCPSETQFFFIGLYPERGYLARLASDESLSEFSKWGFISRERPVIDAGTKKSAGRWDGKARRSILKRLFQSQETISISDYLREVDYTISRQQALKDLSSLSGAKPTGRGRGAVWIQRTP